MFTELLFGRIGIVVSGCKDCPLHVTVPDPYCFLLKKHFDKKAFPTTVPKNCPLPIDSGFIQIRTHSYTDRTPENV